MATYKVLAASISGANGQPIKEGEHVEGSRLNQAHIPALIADKSIEEIIDKSELEGE